MGVPPRARLQARKTLSLPGAVGDEAISFSSKALLLSAEIVKAMTFRSHFLTVVTDTGRPLLNKEEDSSSCRNAVLACGRHFFPILAQALRNPFR
jgi:hypothetical protein